MVVDADSTVRYVSPSVEGVFGYDPAEIEGTKLTGLIHPDDKAPVLQFLTATSREGGVPTTLIESRMRHRDDFWLHIETLRTDLMHDPNVKGIVLNSRDVSERKAFEEQLSHQAFHDSITGLANRALFRDRVEHALERLTRSDLPMSVLFMDLDDFKTINDSLGHAAGDRLLGEVGERLRTCLRTPDTAARLGGDEFAILLEDGGEGVGAADVAVRILKALDAPFQLDGKEVFVRASIGIASSGVERDDRAGGCGGAPPQRGRRDVHREGSGEEPVSGLRTEDARHGPPEAGAEGGPPAGRRQRGVRPPLPAGDPSGERGDRWVRGPGPLEPSHPGTRQAPRLHPPRRGDGPDRSDRDVGARGSVPERAGAAAGRFRRTPAAHGGEPVRQAAAASRDRPGDRAGAPGLGACRPSVSCSRSPRA